MVLFRYEYSSGTERTITVCMAHEMQLQERAAYLMVLNSLCISTCIVQIGRVNSSLRVLNVANALDGWMCVCLCSGHSDEWLT